MAKRGYKLQEFVAHAGNVNCLSFGKKNCRVFITGGDDQKVNLWSVGKPTSLMSLCGHTSPVESAAFDSAEVLVVAGSSSGAIKLWDLEETKMVRTLTGHRSYCTAVEFHPFGEFFASGSMDTNLKIWDIRKKGCIHTYKGHTRGISTIRFTPDGRWVVSGGFDNVVKIWDLTAGKLLHDFKFHEGHIRSIEFHPLEFLLATGSADKTVKFWDLETFEMIGSARREATGVRSIAFHPDGRNLFCGLDDSLKVYSWEPVICHDSIDMGWSTLGDLCIHDGKLLGGAYYENSVAVWVADVSLIEPYGTRLSLEQHSHSEQKSDSQDSLLEKNENSVKSKSNMRSTTPDSDSKDIKTIYVDRVNSVTSKTTEGVNSFTSKTRGGVISITPKSVETTDVPKVVHSKVDTVNVPNVVHPKVDTVDVPKVVHPKVDTVDVPKVVHPMVDTTDAPKVVHPMADTTDVPKVVHSKVDTTNVPKVVRPKVDTTDVHKVVNSSDSKEIRSIRIQKRRPSAKPNAPSINRTLVLPSIVPRDGSDGKYSVVSRRQSIASTKGSSVISAKPPHSRRLSTSHFDMESMSVSLQSLPSANMRSSLGSKKESNRRNRLVTVENATDFSEEQPSNIRTVTEKSDRISTQEKHSNIRTVTEKSDRTTTQEKQSNIHTATEKSDRTSTPASTSGDEAQNSSDRVTAVKVVNGVAVVSGRTRSLVERFERKEKVDADETYMPDMASLAAEPVAKQDSNIASVPDEKGVSEIHEKPTLQKSDDQIVMKEPSSLDDNNVIENLMQNHDVLLSTFRSRLTKLQVVRHFWERNDVKGAISAVRKLPDHSVQADVIGALIGRTEIVTLDLFSCLLPVLLGLLESKAERHASVSLEMLLKLVAVFGSLIRSTVSAPRGVGVDLHQEERLECCRQCFTHLQNIQNILPELVRRGGAVARYSQQLNLILQQT